MPSFSQIENSDSGLARLKLRVRFPAFAKRKRNPESIVNLFFSSCHFPSLHEQRYVYMNMQVNPLITITTGVRGVVHEHNHELKQLKISKIEVIMLMKQLHQNVIKYLTYLILNKRKLNNKHPPSLDVRPCTY
jgi:hypothetical protein